MSRQVLGWGFVAAQTVLLGALVLLPGRSDWPTPLPVMVVAWALVAAGVAIMGLAARRLGSSLTPNPMPTTAGPLSTDGLYRHVRHPIYSGVLAVVVGLTLRSGSLVHLAVAAVTVAFFHAKARWEEARLAERFPSYADYAAVTPRFVPRPWRV